MSQPEISHRCESCGASVRERAMFCPECGQALAQLPANSKPQEVPETSTPAAVVESAAISSEESPAVTPLATPDTAADGQTAADVEAAPPKTESVSPANPEAAAPPVAKHGTYEKARGSLHRASTATRGALADNVKRVEKIRHVSSAMIEEASYDPSLRFVLVALVLFLIFLVLLLLSKVMG